MLDLKPYGWRTITLDESVMLRAFAILAIVFHNYMHWISDSPGENEFTYEPERIQALIRGLSNTPLDCFRLLATYFGHYGVQVFFFLSAYGITIKCRDRTPSWLTFQKARWLTLYPPIVIAALGYIFYESLRLGWSNVIPQEALYLIRQMIGVSSFFPDNIYYPVGPWWFIGVILQFKAVIAGAAGLFILGNFYASFWITTGATSLLVVLPLMRILSHQSQRQIWIHHCLMFVGQLSTYIFLCSGYLRRPLIDWAQQTPHWWTSLWTSLLFLAIVLVWALLLRKCEQAICKATTSG